MNVLVFGPNPRNSTDGVIILGSQNLMKYVLGDYTRDYLIYEENKQMSDPELLQKGNYDLVVVEGTPWIWDGYYRSWKWKNLKRLFELHPNAKKLFLGIGCAMLVRNYYDEILERKEEVEGFKQIYSQGTVIVRDRLAEYKLYKAGISSTCLPCPSFYCYGVSPNNIIECEGQNTLIWYDPSRGGAHMDWQHPYKLKEFCDLNVEFYKKYQPKVYCKDKEEIELALQIGLPEPEVIRDGEHTLEIMKNAGVVLSGRVHCAVPGFVQGKKLGVIKTDSRIQTLTDWGGIEVSNVRQFDNMTYNVRKFQNELHQYEKIIKKALK